MGKKRKKREAVERRGLGYFIRNFGKKHRVSVHDQQTDTEVWYIFTSSARIFLAALGLCIIMFGLVFVLAVYTPVLDNVPGYPGKKSREEITSGIMRIDSLENELNYLRAYTDNISLIMEGRIPKTTMPGRTAEQSDNRDLILPSLQDSLLRRQIETDERYALSGETSAAAGRRSLPVTFLAPVEGGVTSGFNPVTGLYGVEYTVIESQQVVAAGEGTVILSTWTPDEDYIIQIQHKDSFISIYKRNSQLLKAVGDRVDAGEAIAYVNIGDAGQAVLVFELWSDGQPVDPSHYIAY